MVVSSSRAPAAAAQVGALAAAGRGAWWAVRGRGGGCAAPPGRRRLGEWRRLRRCGPWAARPRRGEATAGLGRRAPWRLARGVGGGLGAPAPGPCPQAWARRPPSPPGSAPGWRESPAAARTAPTAAAPQPPQVSGSRARRAGHTPSLAWRLRPWSLGACGPAHSRPVTCCGAARSPVARQPRTRRCRSLAGLGPGARRSAGPGRLPGLGCCTAGSRRIEKGRDSGRISSNTCKAGISVPKYRECHCSIGLGRLINAMLWR